MLIIQILDMLDKGLKDLGWNEGSFHERMDRLSLALVEGKNGDVNVGPTGEVGVNGKDALLRAKLEVQEHFVLEAEGRFRAYEQRYLQECQGNEVFLNMMTSSLDAIRLKEGMNVGNVGVISDNFNAYLRRAAHRELCAYKEMWVQDMVFGREKGLGDFLQECVRKQMDTRTSVDNYFVNPDIKNNQDSAFALSSGRGDGFGLNEQIDGKVDLSRLTLGKSGERKLEKGKAKGVSNDPKPSSFRNTSKKPKR